MNIKRMRGRNHRGNGAGGGGSGSAPIRQQGGNVPMNRNHVFDSSGPDLRIRGTSQQLFEKYLQLGRDATGLGDRVMAESYFQYAEHYFRILNAMNQAAQQSDRQQGDRVGGQAGPQHGGQPYQRRQDSQQEYQGQAGGLENGPENGPENGMDDEEDPAGSGEQPTMASRPIPIAAGSPE